MIIRDNVIEFCCNEMWNRVLVNRDVDIYSDCVCIETVDDSAEDMRLDFCPFCRSKVILMEDVEDCCGECEEGED